mgnify:CR=1 FL=1
MYNIQAKYTGLALLIAFVFGSGLAIAGSLLPTESNAAVVEAVRKSVNEVIDGDDVALQDDDELVLSLEKNKTYVIDGAIIMDFVGTGGQRIAFSAPAGATIDLSYLDSKGVVVDATNGSGILEISGGEAEYGVGTSLRRPILISGTIERGSTSGDLTFQWGHFASEVSTTTVEAGSFLRADQI